LPLPLPLPLLLLLFALALLVVIPTGDLLLSFCLAVVPITQAKKTMSF
jgi:hypothetical protein